MLANSLYTIMKADTYNHTDSCLGSEGENTKPYKASGSFVLKGNADMYIQTYIQGKV